MQSKPNIPASRDKLLFTPGPLTTSATVKQAMLHDPGSWHHEFNAVVKAIRANLLQLAGVADQGFEAILLQGTGTYAVEAILSSVVPETGRLLILANGAYGERMAAMAERLKLDFSVLRCPESETHSLQLLGETLREDAAVTHVAAVHCETTTGILNPLEDIGRVVAAAGRSFIVDAMSSFGALPIDFTAASIDYLASSANKCLEGVPGFSFVLARRAPLLASAGSARTLSLDLLGQLQGFEKNGQFRFTPPTQSLLAFAQALKELELEGGIAARLARYERNHAVLVAGMSQLGFRMFLDPGLQSCIITAFHYPNDPRFTFFEFYECLSNKGYIIYPGKLTQAECFRIGSIGRIFEQDVTALLAAIRDALAEMGVNLNPLAKASQSAAVEPKVNSAFASRPLSGSPHASQ